jgi:MFS family permease
LYSGGNLISSLGTWVATTSQTWLVLQLTHSGAAIGFTVALQYLPLLVLGSWAGVVVDRLDKRRLIRVTSLLLAAQALALGVLVAGGAIEVWVVYALTLAQGFVSMFDLPARRAFVNELVPSHDLANAVGLTTTMDVATRAIGPAIAGLLIATAGISWCFWINGVSYLGVVVALTLMKKSEIRQLPSVSRGPRQLRDGLIYVWNNTALRSTLVVTAVMGTLAFNFQINLPLLARNDFGGGAELFGLFNTLMGVGAIAGSLWVSHRSEASVHLLMVMALAVGLAMTGAAMAPVLSLEIIALLACGATSVAFFASAGALSMQIAAPEYQGRVSALVLVTFLGSFPFGGPLMGGISGAYGARTGLIVGALACSGSALFLWIVMRREGESEPDSAPLVSTSADEAPADHMTVIKVADR